MVNSSHVRLINSQKKIIKTQKYYETFPCINSDDLKKLGKLILSSMSDEYDACMNELNNYPYCVWCHLREQNSAYTIPCRHIMHDIGNTLFSIDEIHPRYINEIFARTINDLHSIEKRIATGMPPTIEQSGRFPSHPSMNVVLGGAPKQHRHIHCTYCKIERHNVKTCKKKREDEFQQLKNEPKTNDLINEINNKKKKIFNILLLFIS